MNNNNNNNNKNNKNKIQYLGRTIGQRVQPGGREKAGIRVLLIWLTSRRVSGNSPTRRLRKGISCISRCYVALHRLYSCTHTHTQYIYCGIGIFIEVVTETREPQTQVSIVFSFLIPFMTHPIKYLIFIFFTSLSKIFINNFEKKKRRLLIFRLPVSNS